jgi:lysophospholipase L1-like esterase
VNGWAQRDSNGRWLLQALAMAVPVGWLTLALHAQARVLQRARREGQAIAARAKAFESNPRRATRRVLLLGDSTGVGVGADDPRQSLPGLLHRRFPHVHVVNRCHNGARVADAVAQARRLRRPVEHTGRFDLALVLVGGNDVLRLTSHAALRRDARTLLTELRGLTRHTVWLGSADIGVSPVLKAPLNWLVSWRTTCTMRELAKVAAAEQVPFIDFSRDGRFAGNTGIYFAADGLHPSSASYRACFEVLQQQVPLAQWLAFDASRKS